jgi:uncharacterized protein YecE (DUF72 family)
MGGGSERDLTNLSHLDDGRLAEMFQQRGNDPRFLDALNAELKHRNSDAANDLHIRVVMARRAVLRRAARQSNPVYDWLRAFLDTRKLRRPDKRPLYRYRMADSEFDEAKRILQQLASAGRLNEPDGLAGALFVAYCAEWFRRESASTFLRWDDPAPDLFPTVPYAGKQALTTSGLAY